VVKDCTGHCWVLVKCNWCWHYTLLAKTTAHFCPWPAGTVVVSVGERVCVRWLFTERKVFGDGWLVAMRLEMPVVYRNWSNMLFDTHPTWNFFVNIGTYNMSLNGQR
jgi:hypothetical protein